MRVLVDTPIWSLALRHRRDKLSAKERRLAQELFELVEEGRVAMLGVIRQELLSGIRDEKTFDRVRQRLRPFKDEILEAGDYEEAARCHNTCRAKGVSGSAIDFLLCAAALRRDLSIFTTDRDFKRYARQLPLQLHAPRGGGA